MRTLFSRVALSGAIGTAYILGQALPAHADGILNDYLPSEAYYGGLNTYNGGDVIENTNDHSFEITGATVTRTDPNTLQIVIQTNYAGVAGTNAAVGTDYGSLFITPSKATPYTAANANPWNPSGSGPNYTSDTYNPGALNQLGEWAFAVTPSTLPNSDALPVNSKLAGNPTSGSPGTAGLYYVGTNGGLNAFTGNVYSSGIGNPSVAQTYSTSNGKIIMSNVLADPVTVPNGGHTYYWFRQGQAVQYLPNDPSAVTSYNGNQTSVSWFVTPTIFNSDGTVSAGNEGSITYTITDYGMLGDTFGLSWAMTCANDVVQGLITPSGTTTETPLPSSVLLMSTVVGVGGFIGRWRKRRRAAA